MARRPSRVVPKCSRCGRPRVLNPCRDCASEAEQKQLGYPPLRDGTYRYPPMVRDVAAGRRAAEAGKARAANAATDEWRHAFKWAVERWADACMPFTSETVVAEVGLPQGEVGTNINNAVGALMSAAARKNVIRATGRHVPSTRPSSHGAELKEWIGAHCETFDTADRMP